MTDPAAARRLLLVHAHPDDETINNGATMALYAAAGAQVTLVTCTRGEQGEVIPPELAHLAADADDTLGAHRVGELARAMAVLGVSDHCFLDELPPPAADGPLGHAERPVYRDSGMAVDPERGIVLPPDVRPQAFALADLDEAAGRLAGLIRRRRPQVVITYEPGGGYGHPDHVQAHRVTQRAVELAAAAPDGDPSDDAPAWSVPKVYWVVLPRRLALAAMQSFGGGDRFGDEGELPSMFVDDELVTTLIEGSAYGRAKAEALAQHVTQCTVAFGTPDGDEPATFALSNGAVQPLVPFEFYQLVRGRPGPVGEAAEYETDLFAGLD